MAIRVVILTISDRSYRGERPDSTGPALINLCSEKQWLIIDYSTIPDELDIIQEYLTNWCEDDKTDLILTTGGTGFAPRDVTPEATLSVIQRNAPGIAEEMRRQSMQKTPHAMLSRAIAGICNSTLIINLPGSPKGALENLQFIIDVLPHAVELMQNDPNSELNH